MVWEHAGWRLKWQHSPAGPKDGLFLQNKSLMSPATVPARSAAHCLHLCIRTSRLFVNASGPAVERALSLKLEMLSCMTQCRKNSLDSDFPIFFFSSSCAVCLDPRLECHSWCTASWEGACFVPSWETSCWWSPQPQTTGCSTVCRAALPTRDCGGTACLASATCKPTASVGGTHLHGPFIYTAALNFLFLALLYWKREDYRSKNGQN